jgi:hypothetical protein
MKHLKYSDKPCRKCGNLFTPNSASQRYCKPCSKIAFREAQLRGYKSSNERKTKYDICPQCGGSKTKVSKLCLKCRVQTWVTNPGSHPRWKGGRTTSQGYVVIADGNGKYIREHRIIWESTHNRKLQKGYVVHHINGIRTDNRPENLVAVKRNEHEYQTLLKIAQHRIVELEQLRLSLG